MKKSIYLFAIITLAAACNTNTASPNELIDNEVTQDTLKSATEETIHWTEINSDEALVATALMAAPAESREGCTVIGFNMAGEFVTFKEGTNELVCLTDNPTQQGFSAACYHKSLEPFMARGRELKKEGKSHQEIFDLREQEAKTGKLQMPEAGATLHIYYGAKTSYNKINNEVDGAAYRYVVYMPWATSESTGLPEEPIAPNHPWIMNPGTHRAHIMITPIDGE